MKRRLNIFFLFCLAMMLFTQCEEEPMDTSRTVRESIDEYTHLCLEILNAEYALQKGKIEIAYINLVNIEHTLSNNKSMFCHTEEDKVNKLLIEAQKLRTQLSKTNTETSLEVLRNFKNKLGNIETDDPQDQFLLFLWSFEEAMHEATHTAQDPMLDLYEWGEFEKKVEYMNIKWKEVHDNYPTAELLGYINFKYKYNVAKKADLEKAINDFNKAVKSDEWEENQLCEKAEKLDHAYYKYLESFIPGLLMNTEGISEIS